MPKGKYDLIHISIHMQYLLTHAILDIYLEFSNALKVSYTLIKSV